ncbi:TadE/TadG family type IV pilus assembly protein [Ornithinimicrobium sp. INDO-MA30-4]|uniref:TadE/TadG family type IV pilus assembly protein n=1 Tax=Ornithinimicrobium sp. INDO-MA30-4 TaxID=2908651 RepID=UPI001F4128F7|nr:Tad domain-containing protein [Ornithinimicrobium sp. INDO-MA30-4]UJH71768.1 Tad domain-containing protein [Ornithinimicrobium sp. INDO-MA30-4]
MPHQAERGSISVFAILMATTVLLMVGLAVDVSGQIHSMQEARSVAREAARAGGQEIEVSSALRGQSVKADPAGAAAAANAYLSAAGVSGSASISGPDRISVAVTTTYNTKFLGVIGIGSLSATGEAEARITQSLGE